MDIPHRWGLFNKHLFSFIVLILFTGILIYSQPVMAWGPFTHAYIAAKAIPDAPPQALFGAMAADMNAICGKKTIGNAFQKLTHYQASLVSSSPFQLGMETHNTNWGADSYAHAYFRNPDEKPYPYVVFRQLSEEMDISLHEAEDITEAIMDYVICRDLGLEFSRDIIEAIESVGPVEEQALVDAFTEPLCEKVKNLSPARAERIIRSAFHLDRFLLRILTSFMALPDKVRLDIGIPLVAGHFDMDAEKMEHCIERGIELCSDWRMHLDPISDAIALELYKMPENSKNP